MISSRELIGSGSATYLNYARSMLSSMKRITKKGSVTKTKVLPDGTTLIVWLNNSTGAHRITIMSGKGESFGFIFITTNDEGTETQKLIASDKSGFKLPPVNNKVLGGAIDWTDGVDFITYGNGYGSDRYEVDTDGYSRIIQYKGIEYEVIDEESQGFTLILGVCVKKGVILVFTIQRVAGSGYITDLIYSNFIKAIFIIPKNGDTEEIRIETALRPESGIRYARHNVMINRSATRAATIFITNDDNDEISNSGFDQDNELTTIVRMDINFDDLTVNILSESRQDAHHTYGDGGYLSSYIILIDYAGIDGDQEVYFQSVPETYKVISANNAIIEHDINGYRIRYDGLTSGAGSVVENFRYVPLFSQEVTWADMRYGIYAIRYNNLSKISDRNYIMEAYINLVTAIHDDEMGVIGFDEQTIEDSKVIETVFYSFARIDRAYGFE